MKNPTTKTSVGKDVPRPVISRGMGLVIATSLLVAGTLAVLILADLHQGDIGGASPGASPIVTIRHDSSRPELGGAAADHVDTPLEPLENPTAIPPWESTPENTPAESIPPGYIPAWEVKPPPPIDQPAPPVPVPPPDPATHRPPMHNPGGVDGDRPPRPIPQ